MKHKFTFLSWAIALSSITLLFASCEKDYVAPSATPTTPTTTSASFLEEFDNVGNLTAKGWVLKNNSRPIGQTGWRQGRYESVPQQQYKFLGAVPYVGFPAYSASTTPNDFVSCDVTCVNDAATGTAMGGDISAWLISPSLPMKNGDQIVFYTRAVNDDLYAAYAKDRMQVRANFTANNTDVGNTATSVGNFSTLLLDINPDYIYNDPLGNSTGVAGYPRTWRKYTITVSGLAAPVTNGRFAFRYFGTDAGMFGGSGGTNYPSVVGIDSLAFIRN